MVDNFLGIEHLLDHPALAWDEWTISKPLAEALWQRLDERRPRRILELGSGTSTAVLAAYAARFDAEVISLEHEAAYHARTGVMLDALGLPKTVDLRLTPCVRRRFAGRLYQVYDTALTGSFDFVFVDGPPLRLGREGVLFALWKHLAEDWELWLKDGTREHEQACLARWKRHFAFSSRLDRTDPRGVLILQPADLAETALHRAGGDGASVSAALNPAAAPPAVETDEPLVSCIMPTHNRRRFVPLAIHYFLQQDYPHRELIIVDDGPNDVRDLVPDDPRIRYLRLQRRLSIGAKRNLACRHAHGELIAHWDDDDWMAPWRLSYQVEHLLEHDVDLCGVDRLFFYDPQQDKAWQYRYAGGQPWVAGGTLCYRKRLWEARPFDDINNGEDTRFVWNAPTRRILALDDARFYVALIHPNNSSPKRTRSARWHPHPPGEVRAMLGEAWGFYSGEKTLPPRPGEAGEEEPCVTVAIPYFRCKPFIRRAVESVLGQTYGNLRVVVVNDGDDDPPWDVLADIDDPRLVRFDLSGNYGRYFADAVVLAATPDRFFMVQDADDWSEPDRVATLLDAIRTEGADMALSAIYKCDCIEEDGVERREEPFARLLKALPRHFEHLANYHAGLFRAEALGRIGGSYGGYRFGYDTLIVNLMLMTGRVAYVEQPLYTYYLRSGSLTSAPDTGFDSSARNVIWARLQEIYNEAFALYARYLAGAFEADTLTALIRQIVRRNLSETDRTALAREADRLRQLLQASPQDAPAESVAPLIPTTEDLFAAPCIPWNEWTLSKPLAGKLAARLAQTRPHHLLELGSGTSTLFLAQYAARHDAHVVSLEHDPIHFAKTRWLLGKLELQDHVTLMYAPIASIPCREEEAYPWYQAALSGSFDFVFVDGPPLKYGREATLFALAEHLAEDWELWLKDGNRAHERACLNLWARHVPFSRRYTDDDPRGLWILRPRSAGQAGTLPLVSCIMPTYNRRPYIAQAVVYFFRQDYPNTELLIVDDGTDPVAGLLPDDPRIRYIRLERRHSTGRKRNMACEAARGDIIMCWDDDDWYAPNRITHQVAPLLDQEADVTALGRSLLYCIPTGEFWQSTPQVHARMFFQQVIGGTLTFRKEAWQNGARFPDKSLAEDAALLKALLRQGARLKKLPTNDTFIYIRHDANSWRFKEGRFVDHRGWSVVAQPTFMPAADLAFYQSLCEAVCAA